MGGVCLEVLIVLLILQAASEAAFHTFNNEKKSI